MNNCYHAAMRSLHFEDMALLLDRPEDRAELAREFARAGWTVLPQIEGKVLKKVTRYESRYFRRLIEEKRLPSMSEDQLVIGLD